MQELFNAKGDELGEVYEIPIDKFRDFFTPGSNLFIQAAGVWVGKPLLFPLGIAATEHYFQHRRITRVTVAKMIKWGPGNYFLTSVNFE